MGTTTDPAKFAAKIEKMATVTQRRERLIVNEGAFATKQIIIAEAASKGVQTTSRIAGGRWGVGYDVKGFTNPSALVRIRGPFHLVDSPPRPHTIGPRRRGRRRTGKKAVAYGPGSVFRSVQHPGTKGKSIFPAAKLKARLAVPKVMSRSVISGWREALR
jgi:hypothetical protein